MAKVFLHTRDQDETTTMNEERIFARVPAIGEHLSASSKPPWYRVTGVVHHPSEETDFDADVYAVQVDYHGTLKSFFAD